MVCGNPVFPISECTDLESASMMVMERDVAKLRSKTRGLQTHPPPSFLVIFGVVGGWADNEPVCDRVYGSILAVESAKRNLEMFGATCSGKNQILDETADLLHLWICALVV